MYTVYTTSTCTFCHAAKRLLEQKGLEFKEISLDGKDDLRLKLSQENQGYRTVPMIFEDEQFIGGFQELQAKLQNTP